MDKIPKQLHNPNLRFYLVARNKKLPMEKRWNTEVNYPFFHSRLQEHLLRKGNYGVVCGFGDLIVLDFDCRTYYNEIIERGILPPTFTVVSASKKLPHMYYYYRDEEFKKIGVDVKGERVCDIQSSKCGVVGPNSSVDGRFYNVDNHEPIREITMDVLKEAFNIQPSKPTEFKGDDKVQPDKIQNTINILLHNKIPQRKEHHFECPMHPMSGGGNLHVMPNGKLHCFHCGRTWHNVHRLIDELEFKKKNLVRLTL